MPTDSSPLRAVKPSPPLLRLLLWLGLALFAAALVHGSSPIGMMDQGDYPRTVSRIVGEPLPVSDDDAPGAPATRWALREGIPRPNPSAGTPSFLFAAAAGVQAVYQDHFDLTQLALAAKLVWLAALGLFAVALGRQLRAGAKGQALLAASVLALSFAAHNVAFLQSLYGEFSFVLGLPLLLAAMLWREGGLRTLMMFSGLVLCGGAKTQFFYLPLLVLAVLWLQARGTDVRLRASTVAAVVLAQLICIAPLLVSDVMGFNRHHATYQGSYLAMSPDELDRLGLDSRERACIGVDAWGNRLASLQATQATPGDGPCPGAQAKTFGDTLRPYAVAPAAAWRLLSTGLLPHLTVDYFHVDRRVRYVVPLHADRGPVTGWLRATSHLRDALVRPWVVVVLLVVAMALALRSLRRQPALAAALLLLALVFASQVAVSLLGEGVRDLSKHLAGAQFALDLMMVLMGALLVTGLRPSRPAIAAGR